MRLQVCASLIKEPIWRDVPRQDSLPGMDLRAALTVVGDGPVGAVGRKIDEQFGMPPGHEAAEWALGMKMVIELREDCGLEAGHGAAHHRISRAGDFRLPLRSS